MLFSSDCNCSRVSCCSPVEGIAFAFMFEFRLRLLRSIIVPPRAPSLYPTVLFAIPPFVVLPRSSSLGFIIGALVDDFLVFNRCNLSMRC